MKRVFATLIIFGTIALFSTTAFSQLNQFVGSFTNSDSATRGMTRVEITQTGASLQVQVWGSCSPSECDWGVVSGFAYSENISSNPVTSARTVSAVYRKSFAETWLIIRPLGGNRLQVESFTRFTDNSGRAAYSTRETFIKQNGQTSSNEDCLSYNPNNLRLVNEGANGFLLTDGVSRMLMLDNLTDARNALALARRHTSHCFIGRNNTRADRLSYIVDYWKGDSGIETTLTNEDCLSYNPNNLTLENEGDRGFLLTDNVSRMLMLDNRDDARQAKQLAENNTKHCFIGRSNTRPNRRGYIFHYWK